MSVRRALAPVKPQHARFVRRWTLQRRQTDMRLSTALERDARKSGSRSRRQPLAHPARAFAAKADPVVQAILAGLPEFDALRPHAIAAPEGRTRHIARVSLRRVLHFALQRLTVGDHFALSRDPRAELMSARTRAKVRIRLRRRQRLDGAFDTHLTAENRPMED